MYEPKWDGFRLVIVRDRDATSLWSRQGKDLSRYFPELVAAAAAQVPEGFIIDGEAVVWTADRLDFSSLQHRLTTNRAALAGLVREQPASFAAFDLLAVDGRDIRALRLRDRRSLLELLAQGWTPPLNLSPVTTDQEQATEWFEQLPPAGIEGLVVKGADQRYEGGERQWLKVKHRHTIDVVCAAVIGAMSQPEALVVGLPIDGALRIVGRTAPLRATTARTIAGHLRPPKGAHPWPHQVKPGALDRFNSRAGELIDLTLVEPIVVEISADVAWSGHSFRHSVRYLRTRPEIQPADVRLPDHSDRTQRGT